MLMTRQKIRSKVLSTTTLGSRSRYIIVYIFERGVTDPTRLGILQFESRRRTTDTAAVRWAEVSGCARYG
jgi:hypothetical protein